MLLIQALKKGSKPSLSTLSLLRTNFLTAQQPEQKVSLPPQTQVYTTTKCLLGWHLFPPPNSLLLLVPLFSINNCLSYIFYIYSPSPNSTTSASVTLVKHTLFLLCSEPQSTLSLLWFLTGPVPKPSNGAPQTQGFILVGKSYDFYTLLKPFNLFTRLPTTSRVKFKLASMTFTSFHDPAPKQVSHAFLVLFSHSAQMTVQGLQNKFLPGSGI